MSSHLISFLLQVSAVHSVVVLWLHCQLCQSSPLWLFSKVSIARVLWLCFNCEYLVCWTKWIDKDILCVDLGTQWCQGSPLQLWVLVLSEHCVQWSAMSMCTFFAVLITLYWILLSSDDLSLLTAVLVHREVVFKVPLWSPGSEPLFWWWQGYNLANSCFPTAACYTVSEWYKLLWKRVQLIYFNKCDAFWV